MEASFLRLRGVLARPVAGCNEEGGMSAPSDQIQRRVCARYCANISGKAVASRASSAAMNRREMTIMNAGTRISAATGAAKIRQSPARFSASPR